MPHTMTYLNGATKRPSTLTTGVPHEWPGERLPNRPLLVWRTRLLPYAVAVSMTALAATVRLLLDPWLQDHDSFILFLFAVLLTARYGSWRPALLALVLGLLIADFLFVSPRFAIGVESVEHLVGLIFYLVVGGAGIVLSESERVARRQAARHNWMLEGEVAAHGRTQGALKEINDSLEKRVELRTVELTEANVSLQQEIARRQDAEAAAHRLAAIVASSEDAIIGTDLAGIITDWNDGAEHLLGYRAADMVGRPDVLVTPSDRAAEFERITDRLRRKEHVAPLATVRASRDGSTIPVSVRVSPIKEADRIIGWSSIVRDMTQVQKLEEQVRQAQKMEVVGQLAGGVAHDFNNLLQVINGYGELVEIDLPEGSQARELVGEMTKAGQRAASLTRQLLAFSRQQVLEPKVLDLNEVVREVEKMLRRVIGEDVALTAQLQPGLATIKADPGQIEQVLLNLAVNARDAMPRGGKLTIETKDVELDETYAATRPEVQPGHYVLLAVSDTGHGMTPEVQSRIFEPFFTTKETGKGTGLGLATVFGIVKQSGGHIGVYSEPGHGTTFKVYLPRVEEVVKPRKSAPGRAVGPRGQETLLLVEDDDAVRALTRHILKHSGYRLLEAANGHEALRLAAQHREPIHLLVSDVVMPGLGGRELAERLLAVHPEMKVLYLSGYTDDAVVRHGILNAEVNFLQKPFRPAELTRKVREVLDERTASDE